MRAYGPRCLLSSVNSGSLEMNANIGMTKAAVLPEPECVRQSFGSVKECGNNEPVSAMPMMSLFCKPIGIACR